MDEWRDGQALDVSEAMRELTLYIVARTLFGADRIAMRDRAERVGAAIHTLQDIANHEFQAPLILPVRLPTAMNRRRREARAVLYETIDRLIAERRASGQVTTTENLVPPVDFQASPPNVIIFPGEAVPPGGRRAVLSPANATHRELYLSHCREVATNRDQMGGK